METGKNSQTNIVRAYQRYLKLQRGYSANTLDAYRRDLEKLLHYLEICSILLRGSMILALMPVHSVGY